MKERILKTKTVLNKMLSVVDSEYGLPIKNYLSHIIHGYECMLISGGYKKKSGYVEEDAVLDSDSIGATDSGRVAERIGKWLSFDPNKTDLPDYEDCLILSRLFDCKVSDFVFSELEGADESKSCAFETNIEPVDEGDDNLYLYLDLPRIRAKRAQRSTGEMRDNFEILGIAAPNGRKITTTGQTLFDLLLKCMPSITEKEIAEIITLLENVERVWKRKDRLPPVSQMATFEIATGIDCKSLYKEEEESVTCRISMEDIENMTQKVNQNPIYKLRVANNIKNDVNTLCKKEGYKPIGGASDFVVVEKGGKQGLIAVSGSDIKVLEPQYDYIIKNAKTICAIKNGKVFEVKIEGEDDFGITNMSYGSGHKIIADGLQIMLYAMVSIANKGWTYFNNEGDFYAFSISEGQIHKLYMDNENIKTKTNGKIRHGYKINDNLFIPPIYEEAVSQSEGIFLVKKGGKYGYLDDGGNEITPCIFIDANPFSDGLASVSQNGKYGYIDKNGKIAIKEQFAYACDFSEGLATVTVALENGETKDCYIDKTGKVVIGTNFDNAYRFSEGVAVIENNGKYGYIDKVGSIVLPPIYAGATACNNSRVKVLSVGKLIEKTLNPKP